MWHYVLISLAGVFIIAAIAIAGLSLSRDVPQIGEVIFIPINKGDGGGGSEDLPLVGGKGITITQKGVISMSEIPAHTLLVNPDSHFSAPVPTGFILENAILLGSKNIIATTPANDKFLSINQQGIHAWLPYPYAGLGKAYFVPNADLRVTTGSYKNISRSLNQVAMFTSQSLLNPQSDRILWSFAIVIETYLNNERTTGGRLVFSVVSAMPPGYHMVTPETVLGRTFGVSTGVHTRTAVRMLRSENTVNFYNQTSLEVIDSVQHIFSAQLLINSMVQGSALLERD